MKNNLKWLQQLFLNDGRFILSVMFFSISMLSINFFPISFLNKISILKWLDKINGILLIMFASSIFGGVYYIFGKIHNKIIKIRDKKNKEKELKKLEERQEEILNDCYALDILKNLYKNHPSAVYLSLNNQKVQLLEQYFLIKKSNSFAITKADMDIKYPYVLQPFAEKRLNEIYINEKLKSN